MYGQKGVADEKGVEIIYIYAKRINRAEYIKDVLLSNMSL